MSSFAKTFPCILCSCDANEVVQNQFRPSALYYYCRNCDLIFLDPSFRLSETSEKQRYQLHQNSILNDGYLKFLEPVVSCIEKYFRPKLEENEKIFGLDYGSGPSLVLSNILSGKGFAMNAYDPFFRTDKNVLNRQYHFVVSTEVFEHFCWPGAQIQEIVSLLNVGASLFILTQSHQGTDQFRSWWYPKDTTHVCFYSFKTFKWICKTFEFQGIKDHGAGLIQLVR
jgi:hypothetical protein